MALWNKELIYISHENRTGTSQKTGNEFTIRQIKVADPLTFENLTFNFSENIQFSHVLRGDKILLDIEGVANYRGTSIEVVGIQKVK